MMPEISLNILDIVENSTRAKATKVEIQVIADLKLDLLKIKIIDNGQGMSEEQAKKVQDPFYTTRNTRKVGLGVPFFKQAAQDANGTFSIISKENEGTSVEATFQLSHINRMPLGDMNATIFALITCHEDTEFLYRYQVEERWFELDTKVIRGIIGDVSFQTKEIASFLNDYLDTNKKEVDLDVLI